jgi:A/G-specific adenine glycosylase
MKQPDQKDQNTRKIKSIVSALLPWFSKNARDLPWRREPYCKDPYCVYVSEIMLQQTQVKTVIPYWERWMRELPTIESAAKASPAKLHKLWEGLGYYTRVRNLQKAAQQILAQHDGKFPEKFDGILALSGIGRYTAGAICSIAFNQPTAILDGNVIRVLTRIHGIVTNPREKQTNAQLWQLAEDLVKAASEQKHSEHNERRPKSPPLLGERAGVRAVVKQSDQNACSHLNQSLMELGALVCTPRSPNCAACPVNKLCIARKENLQDQLPNLAKREAATERRFLAFVVERDGKFLVRQRPAGVVNAHLWEFPTIEVAVDGRARHSVRAAALQIKDGAQRTDAPHPAASFRITSTKPLCTIKHSITRYRITLEVWRAELAVGDDVRSLSSKKQLESRHLVSYKQRNEPGRRPALQGQWLTLAQLHKLAFTSAHKKILASLSHKQEDKLNLTSSKATDDRTLEKR